MPQLDLRLAAIVRSLSDELRLAEALLFPEASCLSIHTRQLRRMLARRVRELLRQTSPGEIHRRRLADLPELREITLSIPPIRDDLLRQKEVSLRFHYLQWKHGDEAVIAAVPVLGIEV